MAAIDVITMLAVSLTRGLGFVTAPLFGAVIAVQARRLKLNIRHLKGYMASLGVRPAVAYLTASKTPGYLWKRSRIAKILGI